MTYPPSNSLSKKCSALVGCIPNPAAICSACISLSERANRAIIFCSSFSSAACSSLTKAIRSRSIAAEPCSVISFSIPSNSPMISPPLRNPRLLCVSPPICQAFPGDALERNGSALLVCHAELDAIVVSEIELGDVTLKMLFANMVIRPDQAALQKREEAFNRIGVHDAAHILKLSMIDGVVTGELPAEFGIDAAFIGHEVRIALNLAHQDRLQGLGIHAVDVEGTHVPTTLDQCNDLVLVVPARATLLAANVAEVGFIGLNDLARSAKRLCVLLLHRLAAAMRHEPCCLVGHA